MPSSSMLATSQKEMDSRVRIQVEGQPSKQVELDESKGVKPMLWALHAQTRGVIHIGYLSREQTGLACNCICYSCNTPLQAVNAGREADYFLQPNARGQFFRHALGVQKDDCLKTAARLAALHMFMQLDEIDLPPPKAKGRFQGVSGEVYEHTETGSRVRAHVMERRWLDEQKALITLADGKVILLKLVTGTTVSGDGDVDAVITIQVNDPDVASWPPEKILQNAVLVDDWMCWERHWEDAALIEIANAQALQQAQELMDAAPDGLPMPHGLTPWQRSETLLHSVLKTLLVDIGHIRVPGMEVPVVKEMPDGTTRRAVATIESTTVNLSDVRLEMRLGNQVPDVLCTATDLGEQLGTFPLLIEVAVTHRVDATKLAKIQASGLACLEVDAGLIDGPRRCSKAALGAALRYDETNKRWIHLPALEARIAGAARGLDQQAGVILQRMQEAGRREMWVSEQAVDLVASLYLKGLRKHWGQSLTPWQSVSIHHEGMIWSLGELAMVLERKGCGPAEEHLMVERHGVLWALSAIDEAASWPDIPFNLYAVVKLMEGSRNTRPFIGLMAMAASVFGVKEMEHGPSAELFFQTARESLKRLELEYARPSRFDAVIEAVFPALSSALKRPGGTQAHVMSLQAAQATARQEQRVVLERERMATEEREYRESVVNGIEQAIETITRQGWLAPNGLSRSIEQCRRYLSSKDRLSRFDADMLVASAHRARGMGVEAAEWLRQQKPISAAEVRQIGQILKTTWLL